MARALHLTDHHHVAICGDDLIVLDVRGGEYGLTVGAGAGAVVDPEGRLILDDDYLAEYLVAEGVLSAEPGSHPIRRLPTRPIRSALSLPPPQAGTKSIGVTRAWLDMAVEFYGQPFHRLVEAARRGQMRSGRKNPSNMGATDIARRFEQMSPWVPFQGDCLFRAFMLTRILNRMGHRADWVFGVRTWPFYAHCWVQIGDVALTDFAEALASFTPVFVI